MSDAKEQTNNHAESAAPFSVLEQNVLASIRAGNYEQVGILLGQMMSHPQRQQHTERAAGQVDYTALTDQQKQVAWGLLEGFKELEKIERQTTRIADLSNAGKVRLEMFLEAEYQPMWSRRHVGQIFEQMAEHVYHGLMGTHAREALSQETDDYYYFIGCIGWHIKAALASEEIDIVELQQFLERLEDEPAPDEPRQDDTNAADLDNIATMFDELDADGRAAFWAQVKDERPELYQRFLEAAIADIEAGKTATDSDNTVNTVNAADQ